MTSPISYRCTSRRAEIVFFAVLVFTSGLLAGILSAQSMLEESDRFEVASIRPSGVNDGRAAIESTPGGGVRATNVTVKLLIQMAYDIRPDQLSGGPGWTDSESYIITAKGPGGAPALSEAAQQELTRRRLQALLSERFHLALKPESKLASGYFLTVAKNGHKLTLAHVPGGGIRQTGRWEIQAEGTKMSILARFLSVHLGRTVIDQTGLEGQFTFRLNWNPGVPVQGLPDWSARELLGESLIPAVQKQLGLKLEPQRAPTDRYKIEQAERPTEN